MPPTRPGLLRLYFSPFSFNTTCKSDSMNVQRICRIDGGLPVGTRSQRQPKPSGARQVPRFSFRRTVFSRARALCIPEGRVCVLRMTFHIFSTYYFSNYFFQIFERSHTGADLYTNLSPFSSFLVQLLLVFS